jgi:GNAT superfamily N-acetyltransferase
VAPGHGALLVAHVGDEALACGAVRRIGEATAEVKRMYVRPSGRGLKLGAAVLAQLERAARELGAGRMVLETGTRQGAALGLYERAGYRRVPCWGEYEASAATSVCMEKVLA